MTYSESESDFSFAINSALDFESGSESDFNSVFINLDTCSFLHYIYTLLNKLVDDFFLSILITESIVIQVTQV